MEYFIEPRQQTIFPTTDERILEQALQLAKEAKQSKEYTDLHRFQLKCNVCNTLIVGQTEAQLHAKSTGHVDFSEIA